MYKEHGLPFIITAIYTKLIECDQPDDADDILRIADEEVVAVVVNRFFIDAEFSKNPVAVCCRSAMMQQKLTNFIVSFLELMYVYIYICGMGVKIVTTLLYY